MLKLLSAGDHVVVGNNIYGGSHRQMERIYSRFGLTFSFVDMRDIANVERGDDAQNANVLLRDAHAIR